MSGFAPSPALATWLAGALGAGRVTVEGATKLSGGAIQENWRLDVVADGVARALVLRRDAAATIGASHSRRDEFSLLSAAWEAGVRVPRPFGFCDDPDAGGPFALVEHVAGTGYGPKVVRDAALGGDRAALGRALGRQLARIHAMAAPAFLGPRPADPARAEIAGLRASLDAMGAARPGLEWALRACEREAPVRGAPVRGDVTLCHRDYRTGNFLVDGNGLTAILDWEFAGWSDPMSDLGWFCAACWRFSRPDLEGGGVCARADFVAGYEAESGRGVDPARVVWWERMAHLRWAVIALQQGRRHAGGEERSLALALTGRIADTLEFSMLKGTRP